MLSIWNLRPLERAPETRTFTDPEQPDFSLTLTLRPLDGVSGTHFATLKAELMLRHVTGLRGEDGELVKGADGEPLQAPEPVRCQDFSKRFPDEFVVDRYAKMAAMWGDGKEAAPPLSEAIGWQALLYEAWFDIANWVEELYRREPEKGGIQATPASEAAQPEAAQAQPNAQAGSHGAPTSDSSGPFSPATANIPNSAPAGTPCSSVSNGGSGAPSPNSAGSAGSERNPEVTSPSPAAPVATWF